MRLVMKTALDDEGVAPGPVREERPYTEEPEGPNALRFPDATPGQHRRGREARRGGR